MELHQQLLDAPVLQLVQRGLLLLCERAHLPNGQIAKQEIINYNAPDSTTARFVKIGLEYDLPPCDAMEALKSAAVETVGVKATPPPIVVMLDFAESAILYGIKFWISEPQRHLKVEHEVRLHAWYRLKQKGYAIPFPTRVVEHITQPERAADSGHSLRSS